eukprot:1139049-Pelagomonas_calceolata.AAC.4
MMQQLGQEFQGQLSDEHRGSFQAVQHRGQEINVGFNGFWLSVRKVLSKVSKHCGKFYEKHLQQQVQGGT